MVMPDIQTSKLLRANGVVAPVEARRVLFTDGGISSNFPIHLFDALLPTRPTFALSLDELPRGGDPQGPRILIPQSAGDGVGLPVRSIEGVAQFASGVLGAAKDWQDALLAGMAGQRERIAHVMLSPNEGGLNLTMPRARSEALMRYGHEVGRLFAGGALDFDEHRWRRALVAYEPLERLLPAYQATWAGGFGDWLKSYLTQAKSYRELSAADRRTLHRRLGDFAALDSAFQPPIRRPERKFPRPRGRLRIMPDS
jgi:hypothetical protein